MPTLKVFVDTSSLPRHPNHLGADFERLCRLAKSKIVKIYLAQVALEEWKSHFAEDFHKIAAEAVSHFERFLRHPWSVEVKDRDKIEKAGAKIRKTLNQAATISETKFKGILQQTRAEILPVAPQHGLQVVQDYFAGHPPFQKAKSREDFPDAFVFQSAKELADNLNEDLHCIVNDKNLRNNLSQVTRVVVYSSISEFIQSEAVSNAVSQQRSERTWRKVIAQLPEVLPRHSRYLTDELGRLLVDKLVWSRVSHPQIPDDNKEGLVLSVNEPTDVQFEWDKIKNYGPGLAVLPFSLECEVLLTFSVFRGDAFSVPDGVWVEYKDPEEHHYFDAQGDVRLSVKGDLAVRMPVSFPPNIASVEIDKITHAEVLEQGNGSVFVSGSHMSYQDEHE